LWSEQASNSSTDQGGGKRRAGIAWPDVRAIRGSYAVEDGMVKVKTPRGERAAQVEGLSNPIWLAVWLLRELAKEGKG